jgi:succinate dehydrogenase / fumarate reductase cytochrome b subunit
MCMKNFLEPVKGLYALPVSPVAEPLTFTWGPMNERPLSPHLQVYRLPLTAWVSITHRATGVFLSLGMIFLVVFLLAVAQGEESYAWVHSFLQSVAGRLLLWAWVYSLLFHLCHGFRHLIWDTGHSFERDTLNRFAAYEIAASLLLVIVLFLFASV